MGYFCRSLPVESILGVCRFWQNLFWCVWIPELVPVECDGLGFWLNYLRLILIEMGCQIWCSFTVLLNFFCGADVNVKVSIWCKSLLFNFSLSGKRSVMDHGWVLVMGFQLTGGAAGVQGHRVVGVCAAVSATITIHDSSVPWWWPHPLCVFVSVDYDQRSPGATLQCIQPTGQNSLLQKMLPEFYWDTDGTAMDRNVHFLHLNNRINTQWAYTSECIQPFTLSLSAFFLLYSLP